MEIGEIFLELFFFCVRQEKIENWIVLIEKIWGED